MNSLLITRRQSLVGAACSLSGTIAVAAPVQANPLIPWIMSFTAGTAATIAAEYLHQALQKWGFHLFSVAPTPAVDDHHREEGANLAGYSSRDIYGGPYISGQVKMTEYWHPQDYRANSTASHPVHPGHPTHNTEPRICTNSFDIADSINLGLVADLLKQNRFTPDQIQRTTMPIHHEENDNVRMEGPFRKSPTFVTPSGGTICWATDVSTMIPNLSTSVRSNVASFDAHFDLADGRWVPQVQPQ